MGGNRDSAYHRLVATPLFGLGMKLCLNPDCQKPENPDKLEVCRNCGNRLLLKDRYRAIAAIGQGGFGRTFLAIDEDKPSKPRCVIKQFLPLNQDDRHVKKAASLFEQEAIRLEELGDHPQIPALLAHFTQDQRQYLIQEFIDGKNLLEVVGPTALSEAQVWEVLASLLPVLEFVHAHEVIHRDVKPSNIILMAGKTLTGHQGTSDRTDWAGLLQMLASETAQGFRNGASPLNRFSDRCHLILSQVAKQLVISDYNRCQQLATQFAGYPHLGVAQRQYLIADASRWLYEMRRKYESPRESKAGVKLALVDFGAAKAARGLALMRTGTTIGSPEYLAPEQARGKATFASDLYSLGVTCLYLLTATSPLELFDSNHNAWNWRRYLPAPISDRLGNILDRLVEPGMGRRYGSATEVLRELDFPELTLVPRSTVVGMPRSSPIAPLQPALPLQSAVNGAALTSIPVPPLAALAPPAIAPPKPRSPRLRPRPATWECTQEFSSGRVNALALWPDASLLAVTSGTTIKLWDLQAGQPLQGLTGHLDLVTVLAMGSDGRLLISGSADKSIRFWYPPERQPVRSLHLHSDTVLSLGLSADGQMLASGSLYDPIKLWDLQQQQERGGLSGHSGRIEALAFSPDGKLLVSGSSEGTIALWNLATQQLLRLLPGHQQAITGLAFSPDGKTLASSSWDGTVKLWSSSTCREKRLLLAGPERVAALAFSPDGKLLATGSDRLNLWNPRNGKEITTLLGHSQGISAIDFSADGKTLASSSWDGKIQIWTL